jgi:hypothetical protein
MNRRRIVLSMMVIGALIGIAAPFVLGSRARILTSAMPRSAEGILTAIVFALLGAGYGWVVGELLVLFLPGRNDSSSS